MATTNTYITYVCDTISNIGDVTFKKMFGEYMVYIDNKPIITVCDNTCYVKMHPKIMDLMTDASIGCPYTGAKEHYILDFESNNNYAQVLNILKEVTPLPKKRKTKAK